MKGKEQILKSTIWRLVDSWDQTKESLRQTMQAGVEIYWLTSDYKTIVNSDQPEIQKTGVSVIFESVNSAESWRPV